MGTPLNSIETVGLKIAFKSVGQAFYVAVVRNWKSTVFGALAGVLEGGPSLAKFFEGNVQEVHWRQFGLSALFLAWGVVQQDFNFSHFFAPVLKAWGLAKAVADDPTAAHVEHAAAESVDAATKVVGSVEPKP